MGTFTPLWDILEPYLTAVGAYTVPDPTYGRFTLPHHAPHLELVNDPTVKHSFQRIYLPETPLETTEILASETIELKPSEVKSNGPSKRWLVYSTWEMQEPPGGWQERGKGKGNDLVLVHGLSDYGLRYAPHVKHFLRCGFRVIIPDLPSYGRSTGINSYLPSARLLPAALHAVLTDVVRNDLASDRDQRKVFLSGASMGGWTVLYYLSQYPPTPSAVKAAEDEEEFRIQVAGAYILCPMIAVSADSRPWKVTEYIGRGIRYFAGALPLAKSLRGKVSDDPRVEEDFFADPLCYHGWLRVATGFSLLEGMTELDARAEAINVPIRLIHGSADRVTSPKGTLGLFERLPHEDKSVEIFDDYQHVMIKVGIDEADDEKRQRVLEDWRKWLVARC